MAGKKATTTITPGEFALSVNDPGYVHPKGWVYVPLLDISTLATGHTPSRKYPEYWQGDIPWMSVGDARKVDGKTINKTKEYTNSLGIKNSAAVILPKDTVCLSRTASIGYAVRLGQEMATSQGFVNFICGPKIEPKFLQNLFLAERRFLYNISEGTAHTTIYYPEVKAFNVALPPLPEQQRIVTKLDSLFAHLEEVKTRLEKVPQLLKDFRQSMLTQAVTGKLTEEWREQNPQQNSRSLIKTIEQDLEMTYLRKCEEAKVLGNRKPKDQRKNKRSDKGDPFLPGVPSSWVYKRCEELSYLITDGVHHKPNYTESGVPFLSVKDVRPFKVFVKSNKFVSENDHQDYIKRCLPEKDDILYTKVGATFGYAAKIELNYEFSIYVSLALIKPSKYLNSSYLELMFNSPLVFDQARFKVSGSGVPDLHLIEIRGFKLAIPPSEEQSEIVSRVEALFSKADAIEEKYTSLKQKVENLPQAILAKAFKGELLEQLASDGDARELLEEIKKLKEETKKKK
ncbi:MAG: restriction endonuclease subunit S [Crocinitomicaceae bacterium]|nr:restriction endonuclease subunit S [Crocinitomicaceae bacterium]